MCFVGRENPHGSDTRLARPARRPRSASIKRSHISMRVLARRRRDPSHVCRIVPQTFCPKTLSLLTPCRRPLFHPSRLVQVSPHIAGAPPTCRVHTSRSTSHKGAATAKAAVGVAAVLPNWPRPLERSIHSLGAHRHASQIPEPTFATSSFPPKMHPCNKASRVARSPPPLRHPPHEFVPHAGRWLNRRGIHQLAARVRCCTTLHWPLGAEQIGQWPVLSMHCCRHELWKW